MCGQRSLLKQRDKHSSRGFPHRDNPNALYFAEIDRLFADMQGFTAHGHVASDGLLHATVSQGSVEDGSRYVSQICHASIHS